MRVKFLKEIIGEIAGKPAMEIVDSLVDKKDVNEFLIAKKLKLTINQTRNILYKLSNYRLVSFTRKKDKRKGWYIYFWTLNSLKSLELLERKLLGELGRLEKQLKNRKVKRFYFCKTCNIEVGEETALLNNFICPECGQVYELAKKDKLIKEFGNRVSKLKKDFGIIKGEIEILREKERRKSRARKPEKKKKKKRKKKKKSGKEIKKQSKKKIKKKNKAKKPKKPKKSEKKKSRLKKPEKRKKKKKPVSGKRVKAKARKAKKARRKK